jgi:hypothetical protein
MGDEHEQSLFCNSIVIKDILHMLEDVVVYVSTTQTTVLKGMYPLDRLIICKALYQIPGNLLAPPI